jgi:two-component system LytT family sensor kinase
MARWRRRSGHLGTEADRATFRTLHTASLMTSALREGLTLASAATSVRHLRSLVAAPAVALTDTEALLAWDGAPPSWRARASRTARRPSTTTVTSPAGTRPARSGRRWSRP